MQYSSIHVMMQIGELEPGAYLECNQEVIGGESGAGKEQVK